MSAGWTLTIRADAGHAVGHGHMMRSLAIAEAMAEAVGSRIRFAMSGGSTIAPVAERGFAVKRVPDAAAAASLKTIDPGDGPILLDSYTVHEADLDTLRCSGYAIAIIDDGCRLSYYNAGIVIDASPASKTRAYVGPNDTRFLLGPSYFPLRRTLRERIGGEARHAGASYVLVTMGGSDPDDATGRIVEVLRGWRSADSITVVLGSSYCGVVTEGQAGPIRVVRTPSDYAALVSSASIVVTGAGGSALECAALGRPVLTLVLSDDQRPNAAALEAAGAAISLGELAAFDGARVTRVLDDLGGNAQLRRRMGDIGRVLVDGRGAARIAGEIVSMWDRHLVKAATP